MSYDYKTVYEKHASFFRARPIAKKLLLLSNKFLTGIFFLAYGLLIFLSFKNGFEPLDQVKILAIPASCLAAIPFLRLFFNRPRPYHEDGANIEPILKKKHQDKESFPSRHLASALVISFAFVAYLPLASAVLFLFSAMLGYVRFALGLHYPSDLIAGGIFGSIFGIFFLF